MATTARIARAARLMGWSIEPSRTHGRTRTGTDEHGPPESVSVRDRPCLSVCPGGEGRPRHPFELPLELPPEQPSHGLELERLPGVAVGAQPAALLRQHDQADVDVRRETDRQPFLHASLVEPPED